MGIGSSVIVLSFEEVAADLNISLDVTHLTVTLFVMGFGIGPLAWAPLSELYGRQPIYVLSCFLYFIFTFVSSGEYIRHVADLPSLAPLPRTVRAW